MGLLLVTIYHSGFFFETTVFIFLSHACTFDISFHLNTYFFVSCELMSVPLGVRSVVCQGRYCNASVQLP